MLNNQIGRKKKGAIHKRVSDYNTYDFFSYYRKQGGKLTRPQFNYVIDKMHSFYADEISKGIVVKLPCGMGRLIQEKLPTGIFFSDGKLFNNYPINWKETKKLWNEDEEAFKNKVLIKTPMDSKCEIRWDRKNRFFKNRTVYRFVPVRSLLAKARENDEINSGSVPFRYINNKML